MMDIVGRTPPHDIRGIFHKRLARAAVGFLTGGPTAALAGLVSGGGGGGSQPGRGVQRERKAAKALELTSERIAVGRAHLAPVQAFETPRIASLTRSLVATVGGAPVRSFRGGGPSNLLGIPCIPPWFRNPVTGKCELDLVRGPGGGGTGPIRDQPGTDLVVFEDAVTGAFGMPAIRPVVQMRAHSTCPKGMVLGDDELCYPRAVLRRDSRFRKWRPGTRPVLTGGEVRAIAKGRSAIIRGRDRMAGLGVTVKKKG